MNTLKTGVTTDKDGSKVWFLDDMLSKTVTKRKKILHVNKNGLTTDKDGNKFWFLDGKQHREDGPASEYISGDKFWYLNGELHRVDGPAQEWEDGSTRWYLNGIRMSQEEHTEKVKNL